MSNEKFKTITFANNPSLQSPLDPTIETVRGGRIMESNPVRNIMDAADTLLGSTRRTLFRMGRMGSSDWLCSGTLLNSSSAAQNVPSYNQNRSVASTRFALTPGSMFRMRILAAESGETYGQVQVDGLGNNTTLYSGSQGSVILSATFYARPTAGAGLISASTVHEIDIPGSEQNLGIVTGTTYDVSRRLIRRISDVICPQLFHSNKEISARFSEDSFVDVEILHRNSPRIVDLSLVEEPRIFTLHHASSSESAAHVYTAIQHPTVRPQTKMISGATYQEPRYGTEMMMSVTEQQIARLSPIIMNWSSYAEQDLTGLFNAGPTYTLRLGDQIPMTITASSYVNLITGAPFAYADSAMGWRMPGEFVQRFDQADDMVLRQRANCVPVVAHVECTQATGSIRFQSSDRSFYDMQLTGSGGARRWYTDHFFLEAPVNSDDPRGLLQIAVRSDAGATEFYNIALAVDGRRLMTTV